MWIPFFIFTYRMRYEILASKIRIAKNEMDNKEKFIELLH